MAHNKNGIEPAWMIVLGILLFIFSDLIAKAAAVLLVVYGVYKWTQTRGSGKSASSNAQKRSPNHNNDTEE